MTDAQINAAIVLAVAAVAVAVGRMIYLSRMCDDGEPHQWQVWVPTGAYRNGSPLMDRMCLKCGWVERREVE